MATAKRNARIEITADDKTAAGVRSAKTQLNTMRREQERANRAAGNQARRQAAFDQRHGMQQRERVSSAIGGAAKSFGAGMLASAGFDVAGSLGSMVSDVFDFEKELTRFQIDAQLAGDRTAQFRNEITDTSRATGRSRLEILQAAHAYQILTGDAAGAIGASRLMAETMNATGASGQDVAGTLAALQHMKIDPKNYRQALDILVYQGHKGAVELRDLAGQMGSLQPMFSAFAGGNSVRGLAELGAGMQEARKGFGSADEMATGMRAAMSELIDPKTMARARKLGVNLRLFDIDPKTKRQIPRDFMAIMGDIRAQVGDDPVKLREIFTNIRGFRAIQAMVQNYDEMARLAESAANSDQVARDNLTYMQSPAARIERAFNNIKLAIADAMTPERIERFVEGLQRASTAISAIVDKADKVTAFLDKWGLLRGVEDNYHDVLGHGTMGGAASNAFGEGHRAAMLGNRYAQMTGHPEDDGAPDVYAQGTGPGYVLRQQAFIKSQMASEDLVTKALSEQARGGTPTYTLSELMRLMPQMAGASNGGQMEVLIAAAIAKGFDQLKANIVVKADSNAIAGAGDNAPINRSTRAR